MLYHSVRVYNDKARHDLCVERPTIEVVKVKDGFKARYIGKETLFTKGITRFAKLHLVKQTGKNTHICKLFSNGKFTFFQLHLVVR